MLVYTPKKMAARFIDAQIAVLRAYYKKGMVSTGKNVVMAAAKQAGLNCKQIKVRDKLQLETTHPIGMDQTDKL